jgi:hypothetical protein
MHGDGRADDPAANDTCPERGARGGCRPQQPGRAGGQQSGQQLTPSAIELAHGAEDCRTVRAASKPLRPRCRRERRL